MAGHSVPKVEQTSRQHPSPRSGRNRAPALPVDSAARTKAPTTPKRTSRQSRVAPVIEKIMMSKGAENGEARRKVARRNRGNLKIDTKADVVSNLAVHTPATAASTPSYGTPNGVRGGGDLRSPGARKSPVNSNEHIPDFITQTDKYGNATTPRLSPAIQDAKKNPRGDDGDNLDIDPCETLLDSIRLMCCCLVPESAVITKQTQSNLQTVVTTQLTEKDKENDTVRLLPPIHPDDRGKKCLVLDLDETLVHSSFRAVAGADFVIPVQIEDVVHFVYVAKRPGVDEFLLEMSKHYEIIIYTASLNKYADPLLDLLDTHKVIRTRLFRESCVYFEGNYVKDMSLINRDLSQSIIVDNSPNSYVFHPENAIDCSSFIDDPNDRELDQIGACLVGIKDVKDVRNVCTRWREWPDVDIGETLSPENQ